MAPAPEIDASPLEAVTRRMKFASSARALAAAALVAAALLGGSFAVSRAMGRIDTTHTARDRYKADACILGAIVIYTDPYIGARLSSEEVIADIARMCAVPFRIYSEDLGLDPADARRLLRRTIEAGLRGQLRQATGRRRATPAEPARHRFRPPAAPAQRRESSRRLFRQS